MQINTKPQTEYIPMQIDPGASGPEEEEFDDAEDFTAAPDFPISNLQPVQRDIVRSVIDTYNIDSGVVGLGSFGVIGAAMGSSFRVEGAVGGQTTYGNLMVLISARRSEGKGTVAKKLMQPIFSLNEKLQINYKSVTKPRLMGKLKIAQRQQSKCLGGKEEEISEETVARLEREIEELNREIAAVPSFYIGSATGPALVEALSRNKEVILLYSADAGDAVRVALGRYTSDGRGDIDLMLSGYSVEPNSEARVGRGCHHFKKPCVSALWYVQPTLLNEILSSSESVDRGLCARFLFAKDGKSVVSYDDGEAKSVPDRVQNSWDSAITSIYSAREGGDHVLQCHPEARELFLKFHNEIVDLRNGRMRVFQGDLGRARENAVRIALGQAVLGAISAGKRPEIVEASHAQVGIDVVRYSIQTYASIKLPLAGNFLKSKLDKILEWCGGVNGSVTMRDIKKNLSFCDGEINELLGKYPQWIRKEEKQRSSSGGRPSPIIVRIQ